MASAFFLLATVCNRSTHGEARPSPSPPPSRDGSPTPGPTTPLPRVGHPIVLIVMENRGYSAVVGSPTAPYLNHMLIPSGRLFTNYRAVSHPSLPSYLACGAR